MCIKQFSSCKLLRTVCKWVLMEQGSIMYFHNNPFPRKIKLGIISLNIGQPQQHLSKKSKYHHDTRIIFLPYIEAKCIYIHMWNIKELSHWKLITIYYFIIAENCNLNLIYEVCMIFQCSYLVHSDILSTHLK